MKSIRSLLSLLLVTGTLGLGAQPLRAQAIPQGVIFAERLGPGINYCHMKFPAITEQSLFSNHPVLNSPDSGDIIDFYGPCDEDPIGKDQVWHQKLDVEHQLDND